MVRFQYRKEARSGLTVKAEYLKIPVEMSVFSLKNKKVRPVQVFLTCHFLFSGRCNSSKRPTKQISKLLTVSERTAYRAFEWLINRGWIYRENRWFHFLGIDKIHKLENWEFKRSGTLFMDDLQTIKAFMAGVVLASIVRTRGRNRQRERLLGGSVNAVSLSTFAKALNVSRSTAYNLRKKAHDKKYIKNDIALVEVTNLSRTDLNRLRSENIEKAKLKLANGIKDKFSVNRLRFCNGSVHLQKPNNIKPLVPLKHR